MKNLQFIENQALSILLVGYLIPYNIWIWLWINIWIWKKSKNKKKKKIWKFLYIVDDLKKNDIITELYLSKDINEAIGKMQPYELQDDLRQEVFLVLCEMDEERLQQMYSEGYLKYFIVRTILNMAKSDRSQFAKTFRKIYEPITDIGFTEEYDESLTTKLYASMEILHWYEKEVFKLFSESGNLLQISRDTNIPYRSLLKTIKKVRTLLKYKIRNQIEE